MGDGKDKFGYLQVGIAIVFIVTFIVLDYKFKINEIIEKHWEGVNKYYFKNVDASK